MTDDGLDIAELMQNKDMLRACAQKPFRSRALGSRLNFADFTDALRNMLNELGLRLPSDKQLRLIFKKHCQDGTVGIEEYEALLFRLLCFLRASEELDVTPTMTRDVTPRRAGERDMHWREEFITKNPRKFHEVYGIMTQLGKGNFGTVYKVAHKARSGKKANNNAHLVRVCKVIGKEAVQKTGATLAKVREELAVLKHLDHPHVLRVFEDFEDDSNFYLIMEPCQGGDLEHFMKNLEPMETGPYEFFVATVLQHTLSAVAYCHQRGVVHKDLKPENIMLLTPAGTPARDTHVVVVDFGLAEMFPDHAARSKVVSGTPAYMAPEVWTGNSGKSCDVWSCGVVLFYLLSGRLPFNASRAKDFGRITAAQEPEWILMGGASREAMALCKEMLSKQEQARPTAPATLRAPWFVKHGLARNSQCGALALSSEQVGSLKELCERTEFEKFVTRLVATQISAGQQRRANEAFCALDANNDGVLSRQELVHGLLALGVSQDHAQWVVDELDVSGTGEVSYTEFLAGYLNLRAQSPAEQDRLLSVAWRQFSPDDDGRVEMNSIQDALAARGMTVADLPVDLLSALRRDACSSFTFKAFKVLLLGNRQGGSTPTAARTPIGSTTPSAALAKLWTKVTGKPVF